MSAANVTQVSLYIANKERLHGEVVEVIIERLKEMGSNNTFPLLLPLIFSLLMIEKSMASRILAENNPPPPPDKDNSRIGVDGSESNRDGSHKGDAPDKGMVLVPPPVARTWMSQAGTPSNSARAIVVAPTNAKVDVATAVSPTSATSKASVTSNSSASSSSATSRGTVSKSSFTTISQSSSATLVKQP